MQMTIIPYKVNTCYNKQKGKVKGYICIVSGNEFS